MVQAVAADGPDQPLHVGPLPWAGRSGEDFLNTQALDSLEKVPSVDLVAVSQQVRWRGVVWKGLNHLLPCPEGRRVLGHIEVNQASAVMSKHHQDK